VKAHWQTYRVRFVETEVSSSEKINLVQPEKWAGAFIAFLPIFFCASVLLIARGNLLLEAFDVYLFADGFDQIFFSTKL